MIVEINGKMSFCQQIGLGITNHIFMELGKNLIILGLCGYMRVALYARVSTKNKGQDVETQFIRLREYCETKGWEWDEFREQGISGTKTARPELDRLMANLDSYAGVIVLRIDRLGRSVDHLRKVIAIIRQKGLWFEALDQGLKVNPDKNDPVTNLFMTMIEGFAEFEHELISDRVTDGIARTRRSGKHWGRKRRIDERNVSLGQIVELRAQGKSVREISQTIGIGKSTIYNILRYSQE